MDELLNEHEQSERVRSWLQRNAAGLIGGIGLGLALVWGWQWWQGQRDAQAAAASNQYDGVIQQIAADPAKAAAVVAALPADDAYGVLARLELAKKQVDAGQLPQALTTLQAIKSNDPGLSRVVKQRTAQLLLETGKPADAAKLLAGNDDAASLEIIGDAESRQGRTEQARTAYQNALRTLEEGSPARQVVEVKLLAVGGTLPNTKPAG